MQYVLMAAMGYLLGCSNMALYLGKLQKVDISAAGSGNLGASNAAILLGWRAGILTAVHDMGKAWLAVFLAKLLFPELTYGAYGAGVACVLGHIFPFYTGFRGGKGLAAYLGMTLALDWKLALAVLVMVGLVTLVTDYLVIGTALTVLVVPAYVGFTTRSWIPVLILAAATVVILYKHRQNYVRIYQGTEIGLRSTAKGEHRIKEKHRI